MSQIDRHLGIITILLRQQRVTARSLAERFGVSIRTINRDIDSICLAGIPLVTLPGAAGGVEIMDGYSVDRSVFTLDEIETLICALRGTDSVLNESYTDRFLEKLSGKGFSPRIDAPLEIDLADYHSASLSDKIRIMRDGISNCRLIRFSYYAESGDTVRTVEPYRLLFRWGKWYLYAFCLLRNDFRLFKLQRLWDLSVTADPFSPRPEASDDKNWDDCFSGDIHLTAVFDACVRYRVLEEYDPALLKLAEDGRYIFSFSFAFTERLISWLLSFGSHVEILEPAFVRERVVEEARSLIERNNHDKQVSYLQAHTVEKRRYDTMIESRCGVRCSVCSYRESSGCVGCVKMEKPFWGECLVKTCCEAKSLNHCGECPDFPCKTLHDYAYEEEHGDNGLRLEQCKKWNEGCCHGQ